MVDKNLRSIVTQLRPIVRDLLKLERDSRGVMRQFECAPLGFTGHEAPLEKCQRQIDSRFVRIVGRKQSGDFADPETIRRLIDGIDRLCHTAGVEMDCSRLEHSPRIWTDDASLYDVVSHSRSELAVRVRLREDGSLRRRG